MNALRYRALLSKKQSDLWGVGTTRNEQAHSALKETFSTTTTISKRMLQAEANTWVLGEMVVRACALEYCAMTKMARTKTRPIVMNSRVDACSQATWNTLRPDNCRVGACRQEGCNT